MLGDLPTWIIAITGCIGVRGLLNLRPLWHHIYTLLILLCHRKSKCYDSLCCRIINKLGLLAKRRNEATGWWWEMKVRECLGPWPRVKEETSPRGHG